MPHSLPQQVASSSLSEIISLPAQIDPLVSFRNSQGLPVRGTIIGLQRKSLVMEVYNPYSIVQVSEVLSELTVRRSARTAYTGKAVITSIVNTGLTAIVSVTLIDEWRVLNDVLASSLSVGQEAQGFVQDWTRRFRISRPYQIVVNELRAFLTEISRWVEQVDLSDAMPKEGDRVRADFFAELSTPLIEKTAAYFLELEGEAARVDEELASAHRAFCQSALHPLTLRAPFVFRTYTKPMGYAGDYMMVNQILDDPRQGPTTYFQIVNTTFLNSAVARAHRNRIDILVQYLVGLANTARAAGRPYRILNVGCGPAAEIQRFIEQYDEPDWLSFELVDFSVETLAWTRARIESISRDIARAPVIEYVQDSVHHLLKRRIEVSGMPQTDARSGTQNGAQNGADRREFDAVYCAGLFDYLSDKVCARLMQHFVARMRPGGKMLVTNVHRNNPERFAMEHLLEWHLIYRDEERLNHLLPASAKERRLFLDETGVNVFAEVTVA